MKPVLIIPCSDAKTTIAKPAYQLYLGTLMQIINSFDVKQVLDTFKLLFLSAKHGLVGANEVLNPYDMRMAKSEQGHIDFAKKHEKKANRLLNTMADKDVPLYAVLTKDYMVAFDLMNIPALAKFGCVYRCLNARGIGVHRGRLKNIINAHLETPIEPVLFRSGCANMVEFEGYRDAEQALGTSLPFIEKNDDFYGTVLHALSEEEQVFVDNGLITATTKGHPIDPKSIFDQYIDLVKLAGKAQTLTVVVPDFLEDEDKALEIVETYKQHIRYLSFMCNVVIPFHKPNKRTVAEQARKVMEIIGEKLPIIPGIPCRNKGDAQWRLDISDVESLFSLKRSDDQPLFNRAHFFALSEKTRGDVYAERKMLCAIYGVAMQADACRTTALFGPSETSNRLGSVIARIAKEKLTRKNVINS